jgi:ABC-type glycerol-3-phosphate transport system permease component
MGVGRLATGLSLARRREISLRWVALALVLLAALVSLFPFFWALSTSLKEPKQVLTFPPTLLPAPPIIDNYAWSLRNGMLQGIVNSLVCSLGAVAITLLASSLAGYSLARLRLRMKTFLLFLILAPMMIPSVATLVPVYVIMSRLQILDTYFVLILLYAVISMPITIWILKGFFEGIPIEIEEASRVDGCTRLQTLFRIVMPLSGPALAAASMFVFIEAWNDFVLAVTMTSSATMRTAQVHVWAAIGELGTDWGQLMAGAWLANLPVILIFLLVQRQFVAELTAGALKG